MNRAVGLGPDFESPLDFFKIGCGGAGAGLDEIEPTVGIVFPSAAALVASGRLGPEPPWGSVLFVALVSSATSGFSA